MKSVSNIIFITCSFFIMRSSGCFIKTEVKLMLILLKKLEVHECIVAMECKSVDDYSYLSKKMATEWRYSLLVKTANLIHTLREKFTSNARRRTIVVHLNESNHLQELVDKGSGKVISKEYAWIVFASSSTVLDLDDASIHIPLDCRFLVVYPSSSEDYRLVALYQIKENSTLNTIDYGFYTRLGGLKISSSGFYSKRYDFWGTQLILSRFYEVTCRLPANCLHNELIFDFQSTLNFTLVNYSLHEIEQLNLIEDLMLTVLSYTSDNFRTDLIGPTYSSLVNMFTRSEKKKSGNIWASYIYPFSFNVWASLSVCIFISTVSFGLLFFKHPNIKDNSILDYLLFSFESLCLQGLTNLPRIWSYRLLSLAIRLAASVLFPAYSAAVISFLMVRGPDLPFKNLNEFVKDGTYKLATIRDSYAEHYFTKSRDPLLRHIGEHFFVDHKDHPYDYHGAVEMMCGNRQVSFIGYSTHVLRAHSTCKIVQVPTVISSTFVGLPVGENLREILSLVLLRMRSSGVLTRLKKIFDKDIRTDVESVWDSIGVHQVLAVLVLIPLGTVFGFLVLSTEVHWKRKQRRKRNLANRSNW